MKEKKMLVLFHEWEEKKMGEVFTIERGGSPRPIDEFITNSKDGINWIKIGDTKNVVKYIYSTNEKIKPEGVKRSRMVYPDDFILSNSMSFGRPYIMKTSGCIHDGWLVIRKNETIDNNFLYFLLGSPIIFQQFTKLAKGSTVKNLNIEAVKQVEIKYPPIKIQRLIVSKIEELFSELDKGIESLKTAQQQLKTYRQSVLKWAFEGKLTNKNIMDGELPKGWRVVKLDEIVKPSTEKHVPNRPESLFYIGLEHIEKHTGKLTSSVGVELVKTLKNKFSIGDILYGKLRPNLNKAYLANENGVCSTDILVLKLSHDCLAKYLHLIILSTGFVNEMSENTSGVNLPRVSTKFILNYQIPLPSTTEQKLIIQEIENRLSVADKMEESINQSLQQAEALRQSILKKAFEGKLIVEKKGEVFKPNNVYFYQMQTLGLIVKASKKKEISHGEMTIAKYAYLIDKIYSIPTYYNFERWHLGPYPKEMKKEINNKQFFKIANYNIEVVNEGKLLKHENPFKEQINSAVKDLSEIFSKYQGKERSHKTELLATVCKVVEDIKTVDLKLVRQSMKEWEIKLKTSSFKNKAEKFTEEETKKCLNFIVGRGWYKKLIRN